MIKQYFYLAWWFVRARFLGRRAPLQTVLFITDKCNLRCKHCSVYGSAGYRQRKFDDILADMRRSYAAGSRFIDLEGGEPTLWREGEKTINDIIASAEIWDFLPPSRCANVNLPSSLSAEVSIIEWTYTILVTIQPTPMLSMQRSGLKALPVSAVWTPSIFRGPNIRPITNSPKP